MHKLTNRQLLEALAALPEEELDKPALIFDQNEGVLLHVEEATQTGGWFEADDGSHQQFILYPEP